MELGKKYKFKIPREGKGTIARIFTGQVIQICKDHVTLEHELGYKESFLKWDLNKWGYQEV